VRQMNAMAGTNAVASTVCNWNSPQQVRRIFEARIGPIESTREAALVQIAANGEPLAQLMVKYRHLSKRIGTYGSDYLDFVHPVTGLIYPGIMQLGAAATGRVSYIDPNWQQIPREKRYRQCVEVEDGFWLVKADYSQIELRAGAVISGDHRLRQAYLQGDDVHTLTAQTVLGISDVGPDDRQKAKADHQSLRSMRSVIMGCCSAIKRPCDSGRSFSTCIQGYVPGIDGRADSWWTRAR
jgi:DNA polymerase-1